MCARWGAPQVHSINKGYYTHRWMRRKGIILIAYCHIVRFEKKKSETFRENFVYRFEWFWKFESGTWIMPTIIKIVEDKHLFVNNWNLRERKKNENEISKTKKPICVILFPRKIINESDFQLSLKGKEDIHRTPEYTLLHQTVVNEHF